MKEAWCLNHQGRILPERRIFGKPLGWGNIIVGFIIPPFQIVSILALLGYFRQCPICHGKRFRNVTEQEKLQPGQLGRVQAELVVSLPKRFCRSCQSEIGSERFCAKCGTDSWIFGEKDIRGPNLGPFGVEK